MSPHAVTRTVRDSLLGLIVLASIAGGVCWARGAWRQQGAAARPMAGTGEDTVPDITLADATAAGGDARVTLSVSPRPAVAFEKHVYRVRVESAGGAAIAFEDGRIAFDMVMPMGDHRYSLVPAADGSYEAGVVLPFCQSGNPRWFVTVEGVVAGRPVVTRFRIDLARVGASGR